MKYWISCRKFTVTVETDEENRITWAAPLARRFVGQPLVNLIRWARGFGGFQMEEL